LFRKSIFFIIILSLIILSTGACASTEPVPPILPEPQPEVDGQKIAHKFVKNSPTFLFDGIEETLELTSTLTISIPNAWTFIFRFDSSHAGYGDRRDLVLAQVITPHEASITVENGEIVYASLDNKWDMLNQEELFGFVDPSTPVVGDVAILEDILWVLESYGEQGNLKTVLEGTEITATFDSDERRVTGSAGCNSYFGEFQIDKNKLSIPMVGNTEMYCMEPEGTMEQETQYLRLLSAAGSYEVNGGKLRIISGTQTLVFGVGNNE